MTSMQAFNLFHKYFFFIVWEFVTVAMYLFGRHLKGIVKWDELRVYIHSIVGILIACGTFVMHIVTLNYYQKFTTTHAILAYIVSIFVLTQVTFGSITLYYHLQKKKREFEYFRRIHLVGGYATILTSFVACNFGWHLTEIRTIYLISYFVYIGVFFILEYFTGKYKAKQLEKNYSEPATQEEQEGLLKAD